MDFLALLVLQGPRYWVALRYLPVRQLLLSLWNPWDGM